MDDVVDLSMAPTPSSGISQATVRDLQALTQNSGLTITRANVPSETPAAVAGQNEAMAAPNSTPAVTGNGAGPVNSQDNGKKKKIKISAAQFTYILPSRRCGRR